jgi:two-component system response regulator HydG
VSPSKARILAVDDDRRLLQSWRLMLGDDYELVTFEDPVEAREHFERTPFDAALFDLQMPTIDGLALLTQLRACQPECPALMVTGHATVDAAVTALQLGAADFILKPVEDPALLRNKLDLALRRRPRPSSRPTPGHDEAHGLLGQSAPMQGIRALVARIDQAMAPTLVLGESGTGKELAARALHAMSPRAGQPFLAVNCAGLSETLIDSELFGHEKGAFTGATGRHKGLFESADGGVLFLDEIGELPMPVQAKLLRALQEGEVRPVGSVRTTKVAVWVIAATNRHLGSAIQEGRFRADLFYRLSTFCLEMPPLRHRREDIPELARALLARRAQQQGRAPKSLAPEALELLGRYGWPGNVRELVNVLEYAEAMTDGAVIPAAALPRNLAPLPVPAVGPASDGGAALAPFARAKEGLIADFEVRYLTELMNQVKGNLSEAARRSGVDRTNLRRLLRQHGFLPQRAGR